MHIKEGMTSRKLSEGFRNSLIRQKFGDLIKKRAQFSKNSTIPGGIIAATTRIDRLKAAILARFLNLGCQNGSGRCELITVILKIILTGKIIFSIFLKILNTIGLIIPNYTNRPSFIKNLTLSNGKITAASVDITQATNFSSHHHLAGTNFRNFRVGRIVFIFAWKIIK